MIVCKLVLLHVRVVISYSVLCVLKCINVQCTMSCSVIVKSRKDVVAAKKMVS